MPKPNSITEMIIDTIIVMIGFLLVMVAAIRFFFTSDPSNLIIFLVGFAIVCFGMGRRMKNSLYWK